MQSHSRLFILFSHRVVARAADAADAFTRRGFLNTVIAPLQLAPSERLQPDEDHATR